MRKPAHVFIALLIFLGFVALQAPWIYFEQLVFRVGAYPAPGPKPERVNGQWFDDYFVVERIDNATFAIGEPRYYQGNYSYLLIGTKRAFLFDAGSGLRDIVPVVRSLTSLPVTVLPSHLHFDHVGALGHLDRTALPDDPGLRARAVEGRLTLSRYEFLGALDRLSPPTFYVDEWFGDGAQLDLGGRHIEIWRTPGHTPTSVSVWDAEHARLFVGDFMYPGELYAFLPGASLSAYEDTARMLLHRLSPGSRLYAAHMQEPPAIPAAPVMGYDDLSALQRALHDRRTGALHAQGLYPLIFPVRASMTLATGFPWNLR